MRGKFLVAYLLCALVALFHVPTFAQQGGFPSRPKFQQVYIKAGTGNSPTYFDSNASFSSQLFFQETGTNQAAIYASPNSSSDVLGFLKYADNGSTTAAEIRMGEDGSINASTGTLQQGGVAVELSNARGFAAKTAAEDRTATAVSNDASLVLTIPSAGYYLIRLNLLVTSLTTGDHGLRYRLSFSGTTGKRLYAAQTILDSGATARQNNLIDSDALISSFGDTVIKNVIIEQPLQFTTSGTLTFQWACGAGANCANGTRLGDNTLASYISYERIN